ncbi:hypothetical protein OPV22_025624 [Ensete ventricosum]|uniref:Uncharacterized protein n=1 Tax=Ensete ventricosum TaxID=4639 RepID=A0AAV8P9T3_ENSVE|nr:hypothetical protein OPV22_025624 [Ensete ventricosum]
MDLETGAPLPSRLHVGANAVGASSDGRRVHGADTNNGGRWKDMAMAYRTLGVVFGGLVTSRLYVTSASLSMPTIMVKAIAISWLMWRGTCCW